MVVHEGGGPCAVRTQIANLLVHVLTFCLVVLLATEDLCGVQAYSRTRREKDSGVRDPDRVVTPGFWDAPTGASRTLAPSLGDGASMRLAVMGKLEGESEVTSELCDSARLQCTVRMGCQTALNNFFIGCNSIITGEETTCTKACQHALVSLLATEDEAGLAFINCNCSGHAMCEERKQRVQVCQRQVLHSMDLVRDDSATVSCSFARWICEADTSCLTALRYYVLHCAKLFQGTRCSARCRNSVHILYRQANARKLRTCRCEGDEDYDCPRLVANTEKLCFQRQHRHRHHLHQHQHHHDNNNDDNDHESRLHQDDFTDEYLYDTENHTGTGPANLDRQRQTSGDTSLYSPHSGQASNETTKPRKRRNNPGRRGNKKKKKKKQKKKSKKEMAAFPLSAMFRDQQKGNGVKTKVKGRRLRRRKRTCFQRRRRGVMDKEKDRDRESGRARGKDRKKCLLRVRKGLGTKRMRKLKVHRRAARRMRKSAVRTKPH